MEIEVPLPILNIDFPGVEGIDLFFSSLLLRAWLYDEEGYHSNLKFRLSLRSPRLDSQGSLDVFVIMPHRGDVMPCLMSRATNSMPHGRVHRSLVHSPVIPIQLRLPPVTRRDVTVLSRRSSCESSDSSPSARVLHTNFPESVLDVCRTRVLYWSYSTVQYL